MSAPDKLSEIHEAVARIDERTKSTHEWVKGHESRIVAIKQDVDQVKGAIMATRWLIGFLATIGGALGGVAKDFFLHK